MQYNKKQAIASDKQSSEKSIASETQSPQIGGDRQKLLDRFKAIRDVTLLPAENVETFITLRELLLPAQQILLENHSVMVIYTVPCQEYVLVGN